MFSNCAAFGAASADTRAGLDGDAHQYPLCMLLAPAAATSVMIVGNGPISADDRAAVSAADWVIRFNHVDNYLPGMV